MIKITIYLDLIFLENFIMNTIILYATKIILKTKANCFRIFIASIIGSIYTIILYTTELKIYSSIISKILLSIIMIYVAFKAKNIKKLLQQVLIFYITSFIFGGFALYLIYYIKPQEILIRNGVYVGSYVLKTILLGGILAFIIIKICTQIMKNKSKSLYCNIEINIDNNVVKTKAMVDTGNLVKEPITNNPVIIVESTLLEGIIPLEILNNLENILCGDLKNISEENQMNYIVKMRCIPFKSLGEENGMLLGIKSNEVIIEKDDENKIIKNAIIGIYDKSLTKRGEYRALIGIDCL